MLRKQHYIILAVVVSLVVVLLRLPSGTMSRAKLAISGLFLPLFGLTGSVHDMTGRAGSPLTSKTELAHQVEDLRRENDELKIHLQQDMGIWNENARLHDLVGWPRQRYWKVKLARVITRDPANWWRSVEIDVGSKDGIKTNFPVLTSEGLVGRIQGVNSTRSQVILLGSPDLRVAACITNDGETGVINSVSSSPQEDNMVDMDYLAGNSGARPGWTVETSGDGGVFPAHIPIGRVVDLRAKDYGLSTEARVKLWANVGALQEVWVMTP